MQSLTPKLENWLKQFAETVRHRDYIAARMLFDEDVVSFGTVCFRMEKLESLAAQQWKIVWPNTCDFEFDYASAAVLLEANQAVVIINWSANGAQLENPSEKERGRATIVLRNDNFEWKAAHTHFSTEPK